MLLLVIRLENTFMQFRIVFYVANKKREKNNLLIFYIIYEVVAVFFRPMSSTCKSRFV